MYKWENSKFDTLGTNINSYIAKFTKNIHDAKEVTIDITTGQYILFNESGEEVLNAGSINTGKQLIASLEAFGMISKKIGGYRVNKNVFDFESVTRSIFEYSSDKKVQKIRQSRIISFLAKVGMINKKNFTSLNIVGKRGNTKYEAVIREISIWEVTAGNDITNITNVLERIKKYEFNR